MVVFVVGTVVSEHCEMQAFEAASAGDAAISTPGLLAVQFTCNPLVRTSRPTTESLMQNFSQRSNAA